MTDLGSESFQKYLQTSKDTFKSHPIELNDAEYRQIVDKAWNTFNDSDEDSWVYNYMTKILPKHQFDKDVHFSVRITDQNEYIVSSKPVKDSWDHLRIKNIGKEEPTLVIDNLPKFMRKLESFEDTLMNNLSHANPWFYDKDTEDFNEELLDHLWYHATPRDFSDPVKYISRMENFIKDRTFDDLVSEPIEVHNVFSGNTLTIRQSISESGMETPYELIFSLYPDGKSEMSKEKRLPVVRYAIDNKKGYIYAVQNSPDPIPTQTEFNENKKLVTESCEVISKYLLDIKDKYPTDFESIFGKIPENILQLDDGVKFVTEFKRYLISNNLKLFDNALVSHWIYSKLGSNHELIDKFVNSELKYLPDNLTKLFSLVREVDKLATNETSINSRKMFLRDMYKLDRGLPDDPGYFAYKKSVENNDTEETRQEDEYPEENIHDVYRPAVLSVAATLSLFKSRGIYEIEIPTYLPLRWINHAIDIRYSKKVDSLQHNISNGLIRLFRRIEVQIDGVTITKLPDDDGIMLIKIDDKKELDSKNPMLHDFLLNLNQKMIELSKAE